MPRDNTMQKFTSGQFNKHLIEQFSDVADVGDDTLSLCIKMLPPTPMGGFTLPRAKLPNCTHIVSNDPPSYTVILHTSHTIP